MSGKADSRLLVFERHVARENEAVLRALLHVWVARAVVENDALHERRVHVGLLRHLHDFDHEQVERCVRLLHRQNCVSKALKSKGD